MARYKTILNLLTNKLTEAGIVVSATFPNRALLNMNQFESEFVQERTKQLNAWFEALLQVPNITENTTFQYFVDPMNAVCKSESPLNV